MTALCSVPTLRSILSPAENDSARPRSTFASSSPPLASSQLVGSTCSSSACAFDASEMLFETPQKTFEPPSLASLSIKPPRRPRFVRFSSAFRSERDEVPSKGNRQGSMRFGNAWDHHDFDEQESSYAFNLHPGSVVDTNFLLAGQSDIKSSRFDDPEYQKHLNDTFSRLRQGPLARAPGIDLDSFASVYHAAGNKSRKIANLFGREGSQLVESRFIDFSSQTSRTKASLARSRDLLAGERAAANVTILIGLIEEIARINRELSELRHATSRHLKRTQCATASSLSVLAKQWEVAGHQYRTLFDAASNTSAGRRSIDGKSRKKPQARSSAQKPATNRFSSITESQSRSIGAKPKGAPSKGKGVRA